jgi:hypothetical protein
MIYQESTNRGKGGRPKIFYVLNINGEKIVIGTQHRLYNIRYKMIERCYNAKPQDFHSYQGKGITVCDEWRNNPESFFEFCLTNGWKQGLHTDRIDPNGNYEPSNVQFITAYENNKRASIGRFGERAAHVGINTETALQIKKLLKLGTMKCTAIAKHLNVTWNTVKDIKRGRSWKHLGD